MTLAALGVVIQRPRQVIPLPVTRAEHWGCSLAWRGSSLVLAVALTGCAGGGGSGRTDAPYLGPPGGVYNLSFTITPAISGSVLDLSWTGGISAGSFDVEMGSAPGASDLAIAQSGGLSYRWTPVPIGTL